LPVGLSSRVAGDVSLPQQAIGPLDEALELDLGGPAALLGVVALRHIANHAGKVPLVGAGGVNEHFLRQPVHPVAPDDPEFLLVAAGAARERLGRNALRALV